MFTLNKTVRQRNPLLKVAVCFALLLSLAAIIITLTTGGARAQEQSRRPADKFLKSQGANAILDQYIVVLRDDIPGPDVDSVAAEMAQRHGGVTRYVYRHALKGFSIRLPEAAAIALSHDPRVEYVEENGEVNLSVTQFSAPWGLDRIDQRNLPLSTTYTYTNTGSGVHAYVIDSGIFAAHTQFGGRANGNGTTFIADGNGTNDCLGHGTHVAGIIGGSTYGVAKSVTLHSVRVFNCTGGGASNESIMAAVDWVTGNHIKPAVTNMSLRGPGHTGVDDAVRRSIGAGITYVVGAGNDNLDAINFSPARVAEALTVGATDRFDQEANFSNHGAVVDLYAPGVDIPSAWPNNVPVPQGCTLTSATTNASVVNCPGTSMASPHVAGAAALYLQTHTTASPNEVGGVIRHTATPNVLTNLGAGSPNRLLFTNFQMGAFTAPIFRYWNPGLTDHYYTINYDDLSEGNLGWGIERIAGFAFSSPRSGTVALYRYYNASLGDHFYTTNFNELGNGAQGWIIEKIECYVFSQQQPGTVPLYRYWNSTIGNHYYTTNFNELGQGANGYTLEWIECYVYPLN